MAEIREVRKIHFHITDKMAEELTWEEYEAIERAQDGDVKLYLLRPLLARFMVDEKLEPIQHSVAMRALKDLKLTDLPDILKGFMDVLKARAIPKESGMRSSSDSAQAVESPDGAAP